MSEESPKETIAKILDLDEEEEQSTICDGTTRNSEKRHPTADTELEPQKRERKLTEKGRSYQIEILGRKRQNAGQELSHEIRNTYDLIRDVTVVDLKTLEKQRDDLDNAKEQLTQAHIDYDNVLSDEPEIKQSSYSWFDLRDREYVECRIKLTERIKAFEEKLSHDNESTHSRRSNHSFRSCGSSGSTRSLLLEASVNSARLKVELDFLERESEIRRLSLMKEIAAAEAEEHAIKQFLAQENAQGKNSTLLSDLDNADNKQRDLDVTQHAVSNKVKMERSLLGDDIQDRQFPEIKKEETTRYTRILETSAHKPVPKPRNVMPRNKSEKHEEKGSPVLSAEQSFDCSPLENETLKYLVTLQAKQTELSSLLVKQQSTAQLPAKEPPTFDGNAFEYPAFATAFDAIISANVSSDRDRLYYLEKYTKGKANDVVKGFLSVASNDSYQQARKLLDERFGNPIHVAEAYKLRMRNWPNIGEGNSKALQEFSDFLVRCSEAVKTIGSPAELDTTDTLIATSAKLPSYSGIKWCRHAHEMRTKWKKITFADFVKFVKEEAELANDPIFSPDALRRERRKAIEREYKPKLKRRDFSSTVGGFATNILPGLTKSASFKPAYCPDCKKDHSLERCSIFKARSGDERRDLIASKGLCFGCLKPGHLSSSCQDRLQCDECGKSHPTPLHGVKPRPKPRIKRRPDNSAASANATTIVPKDLKPNSASAAIAEEKANSRASVCYSVEDSEAITSLIVPIVLSHKNNPEVEVKVYALLDDGSDSTFIKTSILEQLGIEGPEITLQLNTMHGQRQITVKKVEGLIAKAINEAGSPIELPKTYARDSIPSCPTQIPTPEVASKWSHLQQIGDQLLPLQCNMEVGVLIGCNCPKALKPRQVILGGEDDPYAVKTLLGWGILGPANVPKEGDGFTCHRVVTIGRGSNLNVRFATKAQTKEVIHPEDIKAMFELDFSEREQGNVPLSLEDRKFLTIVKSGIRQLSDGHYKLPLPIKDDNLTLPNNRAMAYNRIKSLKRKLYMDKTYRAHYVEFMNSMLEKGYAEPAPQVDSKKQTWYIPHHGVYHPKKPNKLRVVFDCSAQYGGESLNNHLLQGPDLTNNLTGVLYRFRREYVAIMCDIEAMFYQVKVPEDCRDLLRFLWWEDGDTSQELKEYRMTVHLFGAASSPGCANFALKTTADDNEINLGIEPAEFVRRNFYVDDGLTSVSTVEEAIKLVSSVKEMCKRGGFNLHKFTSNRKEVLHRIAEADRAEVKSLEFSHGGQMTERALGV